MEVTARISREEVSKGVPTSELTFTALELAQNQCRFGHP